MEHSSEEESRDAVSDKEMHGAAFGKIDRHEVHMSHDERHEEKELAATKDEEESAEHLRPEYLMRQHVESYIPEEKEMHVQEERQEAEEAEEFHQAHKETKESREQEEKFGHATHFAVHDNRVDESKSPLMAATIPLPPLMAATIPLPPPSLFSQQEFLAGLHIFGAATSSETPGFQGARGAQSAAPSEFKEFVRKEVKLASTGPAVAAAPTVAATTIQRLARSKPEPAATADSSQSGEIKSNARPKMGPLFRHAGAPSKKASAPGSATAPTLAPPNGNNSSGAPTVSRSFSAVPAVPRGAFAPSPSPPSAAPPSVAPSFAPPTMTATPGLSTSTDIYSDLSAYYTDDSTNVLVRFAGFTRIVSVPKYACTAEIVIQNAIYYFELDFRQYAYSLYYMHNNEPLRKDMLLPQLEEDDCAIPMFILRRQPFENSKWQPWLVAGTMSIALISLAVSYTTSAIANSGYPPT